MTEHSFSPVVGTLADTTNPVRVDVGVKAMKGYSIFPKSSGLELHHQMLFRVILRVTRWGVLLFCRAAVVLLYSPSRQGGELIEYQSIVSTKAN